MGNKRAKEMSSQLYMALRLFNLQAHCIVKISGIIFKLFAFF
ncbi:hypothetical protein NEOC95_001473 [Neochlamydia sp. AcF95]|nr:hypothetical protein [Neochlamydia sp. AcF95]